MPQVAGAAAGGAVLGIWGTATVTTVSAAIAVGGIAAIAVYAAVYLAVSIAISYAFSAFAKLMANDGNLAQEASARQTVIRSAAEPRRLIYGLVRVAGPLVFAATSGVDNTYLHLVIPIAGSEIQAVTEVWFDDEQLPAGAGTGDITTGKYANRARVIAHLGQPGQTVDLPLQTDVGTAIWDSTHTLSGVAYLYIRLIWDRNVYPNGIPRISAVVQGRKIYDPRTTLTTYSTNWALVVRDYLTHPNGLGCAFSDIDDATFTTAANIADELITLNPSGTQKRYDANGSIPLDMPRKTAIEQLLTAGAGFLVYAQGTYKLYAGAYRTPTVTLTEANLSGPIKVSPRIARAELFNVVRGQFVNPKASWQAVDYPPVKNATYKTEDGNEEIAVDLALPFTTDPARAQRIAKIMLEKSRQSISVVFPGNLTCFRVQPCDTVMLTIAQLGWSAKVFMCLGWSFSDTGQVVMTLQEEAAGVYTWAGGSETLIDLAPNTTLPNPLNVNPPTSFVVTSSNEFLVAGNGQVTTRLKLTWVPPADTFVKTSGRIEIQYKKDAEVNWLEAPSAPGAATTTWLSPIQPGGTYDIQIRAVNSLEIKSSWVQASNHVAASPSFSDNSDNLIPNPNSEVGTPALGVVPDGVGLVNDAVNAYAGQWVRRFLATGTVQTALLSAKLAAAAGDQYYFEAYFKGTTAHVSPVNLVLQYFDAAGTLSTTTTTAYTPTTTYVRVGVVGTVPAGSTAIRAAVSYGSAGDSGKNLYLDNLYMRRMVDGSIITDDSIGDEQLTNGYNNDNMIPNANSELGALAVGRDPEGNYLVNDATNALAGGWCRARSQPAASSSDVMLTGYIPVSPGESFLFEGYLKASAAFVTNTAYLVIQFLDSNKATPVIFTSNTAILTTTYKKFSVQVTTPATKVYMRAFYTAENPTSLNTGKTVYGDSFLLKRMVTAGQNSNVFSDNLIVNGSFESGVQDCRVVDGAGTFSIVQPGDAPEGVAVLRLSASAETAVGLRAFPVTPTDTYNVRCKVRHSNGNGSLFVRFFELPSQPPTGFIGNIVSSDVTQYSALTDLVPGFANSNYLTWKSLDFNYTPPAAARWVALCFYNLASTGTLDVDEVEVRRQISTQHVEDNAITEPVSIVTNTSVNVTWPYTAGMLGYPVNVIQQATVSANAGTRVKVDAGASFAMTAGTAASKLNGYIQRLWPAVTLTSITLTANFGSSQNWTFITSQPHGLAVNDILYFSGTGFPGLNSSSTVLQITGSVTSVGTPTTGAFTTGPTASPGATLPAPPSTIAGGIIRRQVPLIGFSANDSEFTVLGVPANATHEVSGSFGTTDTVPSTGTWTYIAGVTPEIAGGTSSYPTAATAIHRVLSIVSLKK